MKESKLQTKVNEKIYFEFATNYVSSDVRSKTKITFILDIAGQDFIFNPESTVACKVKRGNL